MSKQYFCAEIYGTGSRGDWRKVTVLIIASLTRRSAIAKRPAMSLNILL